MKNLFSALIALATFAAAASLATTARAQDAKAGEKKAAMCIGCHGIVGYQASFPEVHKVPMISGQGGKYIVAALNAYKKGERKHPTMKAIAASLTDADMADLGAFYEAQGAGKATDAAPAASAATKSGNVRPSASSRSSKTSHATPPGCASTCTLASL